MDCEDKQPNNNKNVSKPLLICIPNVADINDMIKIPFEVIAISEFSYKSLKDGQIRWMVKNV